MRNSSSHSCTLEDRNHPIETCQKKYKFSSQTVESLLARYEEECESLDTLADLGEYELYSRQERNLKDFEDFLIAIEAL